jgi:hypothetical protein
MPLFSTSRPPSSAFAPPVTPLPPAISRASCRPVPLSFAPHVSWLALPPPAPPLLALPRPATSSRQYREAATQARRARRRRRRSEPRLCACSLSSTVRYSPIKPNLSPFFLARLPLLLPHERQAEHRVVRRNFPAATPPRPNSSAPKLPLHPC